MITCNKIQAPNTVYSLPCDLSVIGHPEDEAEQASRPVITASLPGVTIIYLNRQHYYHRDDWRLWEGISRNKEKKNLSMHAVKWRLLCKETLVKSLKTGKRGFRKATGDNAESPWRGRGNRVHLSKWYLQRPWDKRLPTNREDPIERERERHVLTVWGRAEYRPSFSTQGKSGVKGHSVFQRDYTSALPVDE